MGEKILIKKFEWFGFKMCLNFLVRKLINTLTDLFLFKLCHVWFKKNLATDSIFQSAKNMFRGIYTAHY